jgi:hypothetical protein
LVTSSIDRMIDESTQWRFSISRTYFWLTELNYFEQVTDPRQYIGGMVVTWRQSSTQNIIHSWRTHHWFSWCQRHDKWKTRIDAFSHSSMTEQVQRELCHTFFQFL